MNYPEMLQELLEMVKDEEIVNDCCDHKNPARPEASLEDFCSVCFITNLSLNCSEDEEQFEEETTEAQRETIENLWEQYAN